MLSTTCSAGAGELGGGSEPVRRTRSDGDGRTPDGEERRQWADVQERPDGSKYEGEFVNGLKHGKGKYSWENEEYYEGSFYKDYKHGGGLYSWPTGHKYIGKFYLNRKEGYGQQIFPDGTTFQGLYHFDQRFGPGVLTHPDGRQDVGLWLRERLLKLCTSVEEGFSLNNFPEYAAYVEPRVSSDSLSQRQSLSNSFHTKTKRDFWVVIEETPLSDESFIYPPGIESYSTDGDHLPLPPGRRRELDKQFFGELWEPEAQPQQGYERDPLSTLPLQARMEAHIHKHRLQAKTVGWDVAAVLSLKREGFGPRGPFEVTSELLIQHSSRGDLQAVSQILRKGLVHPDLADSQGHTALIAATVNCHNDVIHILLDRGADIDKLNSEGMSALAVCHVLYYPFQSLYTALTEPSTKTPASMCPSLCENGPQTKQMDYTLITTDLNNRPQTTDAVVREQANFSHSPEQVSKELTDHISHHNSKVSDESELITVNISEPETSADTVTPEEEEKKANEGGNEDCEDTEKNNDKEPTLKQTFESTCSVSSCVNNIHVTEEVMAQPGEAPCCTEIPCNTQGTVHKVAAMKTEHSVRLDTLKLLLERGADPNMARIPVPVLFLAIMAADAEAVKRLLLCGARTDVPLSTEKKGLYPLHVAAALPGPAGLRITELLLHAAIDPDAQACDRNEVYEPDKFSVMNMQTLSPDETLHGKEGGRTALHIACQRDSDHQNASKVVALLLSHRASTDLLWSGHSALSLAIASGNDLAVEVLLNGGADPNIPLGWRVGSALCALANMNYHSGGNRTKMLEMLTKAGADISMPVTVRNVVGTAVDYGHYSSSQNRGVARTSFQPLNKRDRGVQGQLLSKMSDLLRQTADQRERQHQLILNGAEAISSDGILPSYDKIQEKAEKDRKPALKFCYHCGCSAFVKLTACSFCNKVFFCSWKCKNKALERHNEECMQVSGKQDLSLQKLQPSKSNIYQPPNISSEASADGIQKSVVFKSQRGSRPENIMKSKNLAPPLSVSLKSKMSPKPLSMTEKHSESQVSLRENYSCN